MIDFIHLTPKPFLMGTPERELSDLARRYGGTRESYREESPQHRLELPPFAITRTPITNAHYATYVRATNCPPPSHWRGPLPPEHLHNHPVVTVNWHEANAFCQWLSSAEGRDEVGTQRTASLPTDTTGVYRLPTEAEWEYAARGSGGATFPWGELFDPTLVNTREGGVGSTSPVGAYPAGASPCGALDMAGNVWQWTHSLDRVYPYRADDGREAAQGEGRRILRGGCYANPHGFARCACRFRMPPAMRNEFIGFRVAISLIMASAASANQEETV
jgi:toxoflavin biosynthesis protein ToxD